MIDANSFLADWSIRYFENKDSIKKEITSIAKKDNDSFVISYKDKTKYFFVILSLETGIFDKINKDSYIGIITLNNLKNINFVIVNWERLISFRFLSIYFINPFSQLDKVWAICPNIHEKISNRCSLEAGIKAMAEMVNLISMEELNQMLNQRN
ncbi:hypothetical protein HYX01_00055 [Candidatus Woesearchaeota archaeon]|nr:hypothetical protein [Candidatus Woesearchaeota archaeon]